MSAFNVGDEVYRYPGGYGRTEEPAPMLKVTRTTKTTVETDNGERWTARGDLWGAGGGGLEPTRLHQKG